MSDENHAPGEGQHRGDRGPDRRPRKGSPREGRKGHPKVDGKCLPQKEAALVMLANGARPRKIAQVLEVSERTLTRWLADDGFSAELAERQARIRGEAERVIAGGLAQAARQMLKLAKTAGKEDMAKVKAAGEILDRGGLVKKQIVTLTVHDELDLMTDEELERLALQGAEEALLAKGWRPPEAAPEAPAEPAPENPTA